MEASAELLRCFRRFHDGTPAHHHLDDILAALDAEQFQRCFVAWVAALSGVITMDGKTVRRSYQKTGGREASHMVSAFAVRQRLMLGQVKVGEKSNEIVAIPNPTESQNGQLARRVFAWCELDTRHDDRRPKRAVRLNSVRGQQWVELIRYMLMLRMFDFGQFG